MTTTSLPDTAPRTSRPRRIGYRVLLGLPALAIALTGGQQLVSGWVSTLDGGSHRFHNLAWGALEVVVILTGLLVSLWRPTKRPGAYLQVLVGLGALLATMALILEVDVATIVVAAIIAIAGRLHPARDRLFTIGRWDGSGLVVGAVTAAPLVWYALEQAALHRGGSATDPHVEMAHYAGATAVALALAGLAVLSAAERPSRRVAAGSTAVGLAILGVASLLWPGIASSFGVAGGVAALAGAAAVAWTALRPAAGSRGRPGSRAVASVMVVALGLLTACSDSDGATPDTAAPDDTDGSAVQVTGTDYAFDAPAEVAAGTSLTFTNDSDAEVHEMLVLRVDDDETRPLEELMGLPDAEAQEVTEFRGMLLALPGEAGIDPEAPDAGGSVTLDEPGRYLLLCFIPEGADPGAYEAALAGEGDGPPDVEGGSPHAALGMVHELTVSS